MPLPIPSQKDDSPAKTFRKAVFEAIDKERKKQRITPQEIEREQARAFARDASIIKTNTARKDEWLTETAMGSIKIDSMPAHIAAVMDKGFDFVTSTSMELGMNAAGKRDKSQVDGAKNYQLFGGYNSSSTANSNSDKAEALMSMRGSERDVPVIRGHSDSVTAGSTQDELAIKAFVQSLSRSELAGAHEKLFFIGYVPRLYDGSDSPKMCKLWQLLQPVFKWMASNFHGDEVPEEVQFIFKYATNVTLTISQ